MKISLKSLFISSVLLCATAAYAVDRVTVNVPFGFTALGQAFPSGHYDIAMNANRCIVTLYSRTEPARRITWLVRPAEPRNVPGVVTFDQLGDNSYSLKNIQVGGRITPNLDKPGKRGVSATTSMSGQ